MPALTGLEVAARLHAPRPRIVFCTAFDHFAVEAFELHAVDYLLKPVNQERLARTVERIGGELDQQRRQTRERVDAVRTQMRLMPEDIRGASGVICAGACEPADGVGGDYYDFLPLSGDRLGIALGDVSGKGMYAGILAAAFQARLQAIASHGPHSPGAILRELNRLTVGTIEGNRFVTVFFGVFDRRRGNAHLRERRASARDHPVPNRRGAHARRHGARCGLDGRCGVSRGRGRAVAG